MSTMLKKGMRPLYDYFAMRTEGEVVTEAEILAATGWKPATLLTYLKKNKLSKFLAKTPDGKFKILRNGSTLTEEDVAGALTQVTPEILVIAPKDVVAGSKGSYVLVREIGRGAVGHVWEARAMKGDVVAVKIANPRPDLLEPTRLANVIDRFRREGKNGSKLSHPSVVQIVDYGDYRGSPVIVMERAQGSLGQRLAAIGKLPEIEVTSCIRSVVAALTYLHASAGIHRDVKPHNLLETPRGVVLGDLGIVRWDDLNPAFTSAGTLTRDSVQLGSWYYMAPEQIQSPHTAVPASDVYALGVTWHELLTGSTESPAAFAAQEIPPASAHAAVNNLIKQMTRYKASDRPSLDAIRAVLAGIPT